MSGSLYIWIIGAFFLATALVVGVLMLLLWLGHWAEKKETGAKHGFLELPMELRKQEGAGSGESHTAGGREGVIDGGGKEADV